jgi:hypothetical protein
MLGFTSVACWTVIGMCIVSGDIPGLTAGVRCLIRMSDGESLVT